MCHIPMRASEGFHSVVYLDPVTFYEPCLTWCKTCVWRVMERAWRGVRMCSRLTRLFEGTRGHGRIVSGSRAVALCGDILHRTVNVLSF